MNPSTQLITVTLCCSEDDLARVRSLAAALEREALDVEIYAGVDLDARVLEQMDRPRSPGVFVLCESLELDAYQLPELEARFEAHRLERDQLVHVNLERDAPAQMLERIQSSATALASEEQTLEPAAAKPADISDAIALAKRLVEENTKTRTYTRASSQPELATQADMRDSRAAEIEIEIEDEDEGEDEDEAPARAAPAPRRGRQLAIAALAVVLLGGLGYLGWVWSTSNADATEVSARSAQIPDLPAATSVEAPAAAPEHPAPEDSEVLANAAEPSAADEPASDAPADVPQPTDEFSEELIVEVEPEASEQPKTNKQPLLRVEPKHGEALVLDGMRVAPVTDYEFFWHDAANHCRLHKREGKLGWRLASIKQLEALNEAGMLEPGRYWSMTLAIVGTTRNLVLDTEAHKRRKEEKSEFEALAVCVRERE